MAIKNFGAVSGTGLPSQTNNSGKLLTTNGTNTFWTNPTITLIAHQAGANVTTVSFSSIPQTYKHLKFILRVQNSTAASITISLNSASINFNGAHHYYSTTTTVGGQSDNSTSALRIAYINNGSQGVATELTIPDYSSAQRRGIFAVSGGANSGAGYATYGATTSTAAAINELSFGLSSGTFENYSMSLYGWN